MINSPITDHLAESKLVRRIAVMALVYPAVVAGAYWFSGTPWTDFVIFRVIAAAALPLLFADIIVVGASRRAGEVLGREHWIFLMQAYGLPWAIVMILAVWPGDDSEIFAHYVTWFIAGGLFGACMTWLHRPADHDLADAVFALERYTSGNWFERTGHRWWPVLVVVLLLGLASSVGLDDTSSSGFYLVLQTLLLFAIQSAPRHRRWRLAWFDVPRILGLLALLGAFWLFK